jgi:hypothetical protein
MGQHLSLDVYLLSMTSMTGMTGMTAEATRENPWSSQIGPTGRLIVLSPRVAQECSFDPSPGIFMTSRMTRWSVAVEARGVAGVDFSANGRRRPPRPETRLFSS